jgi:hypothetical protein
LAATPVSSGSTTVSPTNDEISITLSDAMQSVVFLAPRCPFNAGKLK